jgi:EF-P beta-lysylation protein EpmB
MFEQLNETIHFTKNWQQQLAEAFNNIEDLCRYLQLSSEDLPTSVTAAKNFPIRVPVSFAASIEKGNPNDPLLRQVLPVKDELTIYPDFSDDPVGDLPSAPQTGVLHKYHGRVLFINTGSCAINCRYCFRRNFPYTDSQLSKQHENAGIQYLNEHAEVSEVILSGGDPLLLNDDRLTNLIQKLNAIKHLKRIRIHTRLPIVLPARITENLITLLTESTQQIVIVIHCNHANEINTRVINSLRLLRSSGINLFNQSVLLKGVNENANILSDLSEKLFSHGVTPYYLHLLDKATGTGHFEVSEIIAVELIKQMQINLPGYLVPKLVKEQAGALSKQTIL